MVVKKSETRSRGSSSCPGSSSLSRGSSDGLEGVSSSRLKATSVEFSRLKRLVPSISKKQSVSKLDVILEAIRYIDQLQEQLVHRLEARGALPPLGLMAMVGKENNLDELLATNSDSD